MASIDLINRVFAPAADPPSGEPLPKYAAEFIAKVADALADHEAYKNLPDIAMPVHLAAALECSVGDLCDLAKRDEGVARNLTRIARVYKSHIVHCVSRGKGGDYYRDILARIDSAGDAAASQNDLTDQEQLALLKREVAILESRLARDEK